MNSNTGSNIVEQDPVLAAVELAVRRHFHIPPGYQLGKCVLTLVGDRHSVDSEGGADTQEVVLEQGQQPRSSTISMVQSIERAQSIIYGQSPDSQTSRDPTVYGGITPAPSSSRSTVTPGPSQLHNMASSSSQPALPLQQSSNVMTLPMRPAKPRNPHTRSDRLTDVCGVYSPATNGQPMKRVSTATDARFHCPRCDSNMTRPRTVKDHFPGCIAEYGNPLSIKYTDHQSMAGAEARRQRMLRSQSNATSQGNADDAEDTEMGDVPGALRIDDWVEGQVVKQESIGTDLSDQSWYLRRHTTPQDTPYPDSRGSPSHIGDGLSELMDRRRYRETPTPTPAPEYGLVGYGSLSEVYVKEEEMGEEEEGDEMGGMTPRA